MLRHLKLLLYFTVAWAESGPIAPFPGRSIGHSNSPPHYRYAGAWFYRWLPPFAVHPIGRWLDFALDEEGFNSEFQYFRQLWQRKEAHEFSEQVGAEHGTSYQQTSYDPHSVSNPS